MRRRTFDLLIERAADRQGFVTTADARELDIDPVYLRKLARTGRAEHRARGLYRLAAIPVSARDDYQEAVLWANGDGVIGGEAALALWDLADVNPRRIEVVLPPGYQLRRRLDPRFRVTHRRLSPDEVDTVDNVPVATPRAAIAQAIEDGVDGSLIEQAIGNARARQLIGVATEARLRVQLDDRHRAGRARRRA
jgi:predicted transcriptional regulator of viral defense system